MAEDLDPPVNLLAQQAAKRAGDRLAHQTSDLARHTTAWMKSLSSGLPEEYFTHPAAFPMLQLPWWLEGSISVSNDIPFQAELAYSTVCGYYFVRMLDDLMDGENTPSSAAMPAMIFFHTEFQQTYHRLFPADSPFWPSFTRFSYDAAETASADAGLELIDREQFLRISSRKVAGAKIPLAAVCTRHDRLDLLEEWAAFVDLLGRWHQMRNDVRGWVRDRNGGRATYFLSEAARRASSNEPIAAWMARDGFAWAAHQLDDWMGEVLEAARRLESPPLVDYLGQRRRSASEEWEQLATDLAALNRLVASLDARPS